MRDDKDKLLICKTFSKSIEYDNTGAKFHRSPLHGC